MMDQEQSRRVICEVGDILDRHDVPFFLILGTCLGFRRDGMFIPHDKDIDLGVLIEDLRPKIGGLAEGLGAAGYTIRLIAHPLPYPRAIKLWRGAEKSDHVDIAGFMINGRERYSPSSYLDQCIVYPAHLLDELEEIELFGRTWKTPGDAYLRYHYGPGWKTPDPKWRPSRGPAKVRGYFRRVKSC